MIAMAEMPAAPLTLQDLTAALRTFKEELKSDFATKDDLKSFATKDDLKSFATKDDLKSFATKDDLQSFATKDDIQSLRQEIQSLATRQELQSLSKKMDLHFRHLRLRLASLTGDVREVQRQVREDVATKTDFERVYRFADRFTGELAESREIRRTRGATLDQVVESVDDLKRRVHLLEAQAGGEPKKPLS